MKKNPSYHTHKDIKRLWVSHGMTPYNVLLLKRTSNLPIRATVPAKKCWPLLLCFLSCKWDCSLQKKGKKSGLEIASWALLSCGFKSWGTPCASSALGRRKGCSNVTSRPPAQTTNLPLCQPRKELFVKFLDSWRPCCVEWRSVQCL